MDGSKTCWWRGICSGSELQACNRQRPERHYRVTGACFLRKILKFSLKWSKGETSLRETLRQWYIKVNWLRGLSRLLSLPYPLDPSLAILSYFISVRIYLNVFSCHKLTVNSEYVTLCRKCCKFYGEMFRSDDVSATCMYVCIYLFQA